jgi:acyl-CoA synthetase (AMP-forming)/AMP-acid ligase II
VRRQRPWGLAALRASEIVCFVGNAEQSVVVCTPKNCPWISKLDSKAVIARLQEATVFMEVPTLYVRMLAEAALNAAQMVVALKTRIANFKVPKKVFVVADLPRNVMGKAQKNLLREQPKGLFRA